MASSVIHYFIQFSSYSMGLTKPNLNKSLLTYSSLFSTDIIPGSWSSAASESVSRTVSCEKKRSSCLTYAILQNKVLYSHGSTIQCNAWHGKWPYQSLIITRLNKNLHLQNSANRNLLKPSVWPRSAINVQMTRKM